jgi:hypothetical protein
MGPINLNASRQLVTESDLRILQVITIALMFTVAGCFAIVAVVVTTARFPSAVPDPARLVNLFSLLHAVTAGICYALAAPLFARTLKGKRIEETDPADVESAPSRLRKAMLMRLVLMEAPAFFGLGICLIAGTRGLILHEPAYWLNLGSTVVFLAFAIISFPTRARMEYLVSSVTSFSNS